MLIIYADISFLDGFPGSARKKRSQGHQVREKSILTLYTKLHGLVGLLAELLNIQVLTDTAVLHASSMAVSPFFVEEVSELQLSALKLVTTVSILGFFLGCEHHFELAHNFLYYRYLQNTRNIGDCFLTIF